MVLMDGCSLTLPDLSVVKVNHATATAALKQRAGASARVCSLITDGAARAEELSGCYQSIKRTHYSSHTAGPDATLWNKQRPGSPPPDERYARWPVLFPQLSRFCQAEGTGRADNNNKNVSPSL